jgi:uncharacterized membrane protein
MTESDRLVVDYLDRLDAALAGVPFDRRHEIVEEISTHIAEARGELEPADEAGVLTLLARLGDPTQIATDAGERDDPPTQGRGWLETAAIVLLLVGGFITGIGWLVGVVLLWLSTVWTTRDKLIGTFIVPGGLSLPLFAFVFGGLRVAHTTTSCIGSTCTQTGGPSLATGVLFGVCIAVLFVAPICTAVYLARRARR